MEQIKGNIILTVAGSDVIVSDVAPTNIDIDQLWLDTTANKLKQWDGTEWISVNDKDELLEGIQEIIHTQGLQIEENKNKVEQLMTDTTIQKSDGEVVSIQEFYNDSVDTAKQYSKTIGSLSDRADGGIRTWHGTEVPTLTNYPTNMWTVENDENSSNLIKDVHVGDVYYLDNAENENILCYGFIKDVSTYKWKILTDEEVKVALKNAYKTSDDRISKYTQTADMFSWLVADDFSKSNVMLSSNAYDVIAENITLKGNRIQLDGDTYVGEGFVLTADNINVETLFSNSITVKNSLLLNGGYLTTSSIRTSYNQFVAGMTMDEDGIGGWYSSDQYWNMGTNGRLVAKGVDLSGSFNMTGGSINLASSEATKTFIQLVGNTDEESKTTISSGIINFAWSMGNIDSRNSYFCYDEFSFNISNGSYFFLCDDGVGEFTLYGGMGGRYSVDKENNFRLNVATGDMTLSTLDVGRITSDSLGSAATCETTNTVTSGSYSLVTSGGVYSYASPKAGSSSLTTCNRGSFGTATTYSATTSVTSGSGSLVTSGGVYGYIKNSLGESCSVDKSLTEVTNSYYLLNGNGIFCFYYTIGKFVFLQVDIFVSTPNEEATCKIASGLPIPAVRSVTFSTSTEHINAGSPIGRIDESGNLLAMGGQASTYAYAHVCYISK